MRVAARTSRWIGRIVRVLLVGLAVVVVGTILLVEVLGVDVAGAVAPIAAAIDLSGIRALYLLLAAGFSVLGLDAAGRGLPALGRAVTLARRDPVPVGELHLERGTVEVEGVAEPIEEYGTVEAPYSGTECLGVRYEFEEKRRRTNRDDAWRTVESGQHAVPFTVTDESGTVVVDPEGATLTGDRDVVVFTGGRSKTEWRLEPGESAYVSGQKCDGTSDPDAPGGASTYVGAGDDASAFTVSDAGETWTVLRFLAKGTVLSLLGLLLFGAGLVFLYFTGLV